MVYKCALFDSDNKIAYLAPVCVCNLTFTFQHFTLVLVCFYGKDERTLMGKFRAVKFFLPRNECGVSLSSILPPFFLSLFSSLQDWSYPALCLWCRCFQSVFLLSTPEYVVFSLSHALWINIFVYCPKWIHKQHEWEYPLLLQHVSVLVNIQLYILLLQYRKTCYLFVTASTLCCTFISWFQSRWLLLVSTG